MKMNAETTRPQDQGNTEDLPDLDGEWEMKRLGDICSIRNQKVLPSNIDPDTLCVELDHIGQYNGQLLKYSTAQYSTSLKYRFFAGDILFGRLRSYLRKFWHADQDGICTTEIWPLVAHPERVDSGFLYAIIQSDQFIEASRISYGTHMPRSDWNVMRNFEVNLPPLTEQRAIAEVLSDVDGLIQSLDALIAKKRAIKQAAMQQLLTGKTRLPGFSGEWAEKPLVDLAALTMGQSPPSKFYNLQGSGLPLIQGNADIEDRRTIDRVWTTQASKHCDAGDLILTVRAPVGTVAIARKEACLGRGVCGLKPVGDCAFLFHALVHAEGRWQIIEQGSTFTAANSEQVEQFRLRVPSDENEQTAIATILSDMDAEIAALERRRDKTRAIKQGMMQQLLTGRIRLVKSE